jgi:hypothetical protein
MSLEEEQAFLIPFFNREKAEGILVVSEFRAAYEAQLCRVVAASTVYRLHARHGWRKIVPWPNHFKADPAAQATHKKTRRGNR